ncbi:MAG: hypothetical protein ACM3ZS_03600 [Nitrososphaerota archaeon]|jgi:hypothetical protein
MPKKTIEVDSKMIDLAVEELSKLMVRLDKNPKKTRKDQNTIRKIEEIRETIQDSVLYAKLKKSIDENKINKC